MFMRCVLCFFLLTLLGCSEPAFRIHEKLETIAQGDLKFIVGEVMQSSGKAHLLDTPYYVIRDLRFYSGDSARVIAGYAEIDYFYYRDVGLKQKRKYRYDARSRNWDRYFKKLEFIKPADTAVQSLVR